MKYFLFFLVLLRLPLLMAEEVSPLKENVAAASISPICMMNGSGTEEIAGEIEEVFGGSDRISFSGSSNTTEETKDTSKRTFKSVTFVDSLSASDLSSAGSSPNEYSNSGDSYSDSDDSLSGSLPSKIGAVKKKEKNLNPDSIAKLIEGCSEQVEQEEAMLLQLNKEISACAGQPDKEIYLRQQSSEQLKKIIKANKTIIKLCQCIEASVQLEEAGWSQKSKNAEERQLYAKVRLRNNKACQATLEYEKEEQHLKEQYLEEETLSSETLVNKVEKARRAWMDLATVCREALEKLPDIFHPQLMEYLEVATKGEVSYEADILWCKASKKGDAAVKKFGQAQEGSLKGLVEKEEMLLWWNALQAAHRAVDAWDSAIKVHEKGLNNADGDNKITWSSNLEDAIAQKGMMQGKVILCEKELAAPPKKSTTLH